MFLTLFLYGSICVVQSCDVNSYRKLIRTASNFASLSYLWMSHFENSLHSLPQLRFVQLRELRIQGVRHLPKSWIIQSSIYYRVKIKL